MTAPQSTSQSAGQPTYASGSRSNTEAANDAAGEHPANRVIVNIAIVRPDGYAHSSAFDELVETLYCGFCKLGFLTQVQQNGLIDDGVNIILGAHLLSDDDVSLIPESSVIYNLEQISDDSSWLSPAFIALLERFEVWDYSLRNIAQLKALGVQGNLRHVPIGHDPSLCRIPKPETQDIDVLFYGSINERRQYILDELTRAGLQVKCLFGVYGQERDDYIARARLIVNIHYFSSNILERVRISYLLANRKAVVSEQADTQDLDESIGQAIALVPYDGIVQTCLDLISNDQAREQLEQAGHDYIQRFDITGILERVLSTGGSDADDEAQTSQLPNTINVGSGKHYWPHALNIDVLESCHPDAVVDLSNPQLIGSTVPSERFGDITFRENQFELMVADDVLEHIPDLMSAMTNCLALLKPGGRFRISVPYDLSYGAWQDPTHVRAFNERSWLYYTEWYWYMHWTEARFEASELGFDLTEVGKSLQQQGIPMDDILARPRAVDNMRVVLTKRLLSAEERAQGARMMAGHQARPSPGPRSGSAATTG